MLICVKCGSIIVQNDNRIRYGTCSSCSVKSLTKEEKRAIENKINKTKKKGTYEWVGKTLNTQEGCPYNCQYPCYARLIRRKTEQQWKYAIFKEKWFNQKIEEYPMGFLANVMCFSTHDIYTSNQNYCLKFMLRILNESKNTILITTKANLTTIKFLCSSLNEFKDRIKFMITITSKSDTIAAKFEPNAPLISERMLCLEYLNNYKWDFNVSIEPFLDKNPIILVKYICMTYPLVKTIWIGCNSRRDYDIYSLENLDSVFNEINALKNNFYFKNKLFFKNSFLDKYFKKLENNVKGGSRLKV